MTRLSALCVLTLILSGWARAQQVTFPPVTVRATATSADSKVTCNFDNAAKPQVNIVCASISGQSLSLVVTAPTTGAVTLDTNKFSWVLQAPTGTGNIPATITATAPGGVPVSASGTF